VRFFTTPFLHPKPPSRGENLSALKSAAPFNPGFNDAFRVARYTEAARHSIETGRSISFD